MIPPTGGRGRGARLFRGEEWRAWRAVEKGVEGFGEHVRCRRVWRAVESWEDVEGVEVRRAACK